MESTKTKVNVILFFDDWQDKLPVADPLCQRLRDVCLEVLRNEGKEGLYEVSVSFADDEQIRGLNRDFRNKDTATDVLSFPMSEDFVHFDVDGETGAYLLGDIVLSLEHAKAQAEEYGHSFERETAYLTAHSMLHLLGYDHVEGADVPAERFGPAMREKEELALVGLGLTREESK